MVPPSLWSASRCLLCLDVIDIPAGKGHMEDRSSMTGSGGRGWCQQRFRPGRECNSDAVKAPTYTFVFFSCTCPTCLHAISTKTPFSISGVFWLTDGVYFHPLLLRGAPLCVSEAFRCLNTAGIYSDLLLFSLLTYSSAHAGGSWSERGGGTRRGKYRAARKREQNAS